MSPLVIVLIAVGIGLLAVLAVLFGGLSFTFRQLLQNRKVSRYRTPDDAAPQPPADEDDVAAVVSPPRHDDD
jgi:hypothetical protein